MGASWGELERKESPTGEQGTETSAQVYLHSLRKHEEERRKGKGVVRSQRGNRDIGETWRQAERKG